MRLRLPAQHPSRFWHLHAHSRFSVKDALSSVEDMVATAARHRQPALALTDHGNMAGAVQLYTHAKKAGIVPFPGIEAYVRTSKVPDAKRYHIGLVAFSPEGYEVLVKLSTRSFRRDTGNFHHKPHIDFDDMAELSERGLTGGIALTTGCFFGMVQQALTKGDPDAATMLIKTFARWFPHTYVELQHHNISDETHDDDTIVKALHSIAGEVGLPVVITQDAHYCNPPEAPIWMGDLSFKPLGEIKVGDEVMGWEYQEG
jgi:DNA polymerase III subunit alpha